MEAQTISYTACPVCNSTKIGFVFSARDYLVSGKEFEIWQCEDCKLRFTQNVPDVSTIGQYYKSDNYISHSETSNGIINRLYHFVRSLTLADKRRLIMSVTQLDHGKILDIGAGTGAFLHHMDINGWQVTGLEPDDTARNNARELYDIQLFTPDNLFQLPDESFDVITMWHVLEHVHDLHNYLDQLKKLLKPNGRIFIAVPNYECYDAAVYKNYWAAYDVPRHLYHFSEESMYQLLERHGLHMYATRPMWYDSFYISLLSEKYKRNKKNLLRASFVGLISNLKAFVDKEHSSSLIYIIGK